MQQAPAALIGDGVGGTTGCRSDGMTAGYLSTTKGMINLADKIVTNLLKEVTMADAVFVLPKGVYQKNEYLFKIFKMDIHLDASELRTDTVLMHLMDNWEADDFAELVEALKLSICRTEQLTATVGQDQLHWRFSSG